MCDETRARRLARGVACVRSSPHSGCDCHVDRCMSAAESTVHTPDPRAQAVLHCEGRVRSSVRDEDVHVGETSHVE